MLPKKEVTSSQTWIKRTLALRGMSYAQYLKSDRWKEVKKKLREKGLGEYCTICKGTKRLQFHHRTYRYIGGQDESLGITTLCSVCHQGVHDLEKAEGLSVRLATKVYANRFRKGEIAPVVAKKSKFKRPARVRVFGTRLPDELAIQLDTYARQRDVTPSKAIALLVEQALNVQK